jgi:hypothetical protein
MKVKFTLSIGLGGKQEEIIEFDDDTTEDDLDCAWKDWAWNYIDGGPHIIEQ